MGSLWDSEKSELKLKYQDFVDMEVSDEKGDEVGTPDGEMGKDTRPNFWYLIPSLRVLEISLGDCW